jgi:peptidyl-prolyl cis-trans isomerase C
MSKTYKARHILLEYEEDALYVLRQLEAGTSFEKLAKDYSECSSSENGGELGAFPSGAMVAEFEKALYHMKAGEVSKPIKTKFGYHIIERQK